MGYLKMTFKPCPSSIVNVFTQAFMQSVHSAINIIMHIAVPDIE